MRVATLLAVLSLASAAVPPHEQEPLHVPELKKKRELKGRFLHITDFHPDPHYKKGTTFESGCHRKDKEGKGKLRLDDADAVDANGTLRKGGDDDTAGKWGSPLSDCDSPMSLVEHTFDWLKKEWAEEVDFIIWTGDNSRHDIDREIPRTPKEIFDLNRMMAAKMVEVFGKDMPIVPSVGNNDIYPHNVLSPGPNRITEEFVRIWKHFIPSEDRHVFERGMYYATEVIPDQLAVISLNTLYWFASNSIVDGCRDHSNDPGAMEMDWLDVQLQQFRDRGMQVWLTGHVPPHPGLYYDNCYLRYGDVALRFQDTIVGHLFGHMNVDHFFFLDVDHLEEGPPPADLNGLTGNTTSGRFDVIPESILENSSPEDFTFLGPELQHGPHLLKSGRFKVMGKRTQLLKTELVKSFGEIPGPQNVKHKDYTVMNVGPSVIPTYIPSARIYSYNITGVTLDDFVPTPFVPLPQDPSDEDDVEIEKKKGKKSCKLPENEDKPHCTFKRKPRYSSPEAPSRKNKPLSPLGFAQFYLPDIGKDTKKPPEWQIEYTTYKRKALFPGQAKLTQPPPVPYKLLPGYSPKFTNWTETELAALEADDETIENEVGDEERAAFITKIKGITPWKMKDLTINSYVKFARRLANDKKMWQKFLDYMFVRTGA
ncbi:Endopolyphosphatase [Vanrija pseudolonga]|uniref:Endopolyphosphatase n=1 Tax=Vanrija pseudolonga TaxID=143232 RepID=A0AAF0Y0D2_9TREE|nr:Endopolyphosphatase [Vanrija pseudolonga]